MAAVATLILLSPLLALALGAPESCPGPLAAELSPLPICPASESAPDCSSADAAPELSLIAEFHRWQPPWTALLRPVCVSSVDRLQYRVSAAHVLPLDGLLFSRVRKADARSMPMQHRRELVALGLDNGELHLFHPASGSVFASHRPSCSSSDAPAQAARAIVSLSSELTRKNESHVVAVRSDGSATLFMVGFQRREGSSPGKSASYRAGIFPKTELLGPGALPSDARLCFAKILKIQRRTVFVGQGCKSATAPTEHGQEYLPPFLIWDNGTQMNYTASGGALEAPEKIVAARAQGYSIALIGETEARLISLRRNTKTKATAMREDLVSCLNLNGSRMAAAAFDLSKSHRIYAVAQDGRTSLILDIFNRAKGAKRKCVCLGKAQLPPEAHLNAMDEASLEMTAIRSYVVATDSQRLVVFNTTRVLKGDGPRVVLSLSPEDIRTGLAHGSDQPIVTLPPGDRAPPILVDSGRQRQLTLVLDGTTIVSLQSELSPSSSDADWKPQLLSSPVIIFILGFMFFLYLSNHQQSKQANRTVNSAEAQREVDLFLESRDNSSGDLRSKQHADILRSLLASGPLQPTRPHYPPSASSMRHRRIRDVDSGPSWPLFER